MTALFFLDCFANKLARNDVNDAIPSQSPPYWGGGGGLLLLLLFLVLSTAALATEKRYVVDHTGIITEKGLATLNEHARMISEKHNVDVAFFFADSSSYYPKQMLYEYAEKCFFEMLGNKADGFMLACDKERYKWAMITVGKWEKMVKSKHDDPLFDAYHDTGDTYYDGIKGYLDAADEYLTKIETGEIVYAKTAGEFFEEYYMHFVLGLIIALSCMMILPAVWNRRLKYIGIETQRRRNNFRSFTMLALFFCLLICVIWLFSTLTVFIGSSKGEFLSEMQYIHFSLVFTGTHIGLIWFVVAFFVHKKIINAATRSKPLERMENKRVYNLVENLCMTAAMPMPQINVIEDGSLNAFASGINKRTYTVTLTRGMIDTLDDPELEAVIAHELAHIRNSDVKVLMVFIVFTGIFTFIMQSTPKIIASLFNSSSGKKSSDNAEILVFAAIALFIFIFAATCNFITLLTRFSVSRNREFMADAGSAEMTRNPLALASALRKIADNPCVETVSQKIVAQLFIANPLKTGNKPPKKMFASHPPIEKRIEMLEQF